MRLFGAVASGETTEKKKPAGTRMAATGIEIRTNPFQCVGQVGLVHIAQGYQS